jgi:hypothetical protein
VLVPEVYVEDHGAVEPSLVPLLAELKLVVADELVALPELVDSTVEVVIEVEESVLVVIALVDPVSVRVSVVLY